jgi:hypothetical protein
MSVTERSRLEASVRADGDLRLIPYLMAGYPSRAESIAHGRAYARTGVAAGPSSSGPARSRSRGA